MKLLVKRSGIYLMMLLYSLILIPFNHEQAQLFTGPDFICEMNEGSSSDLSSIHIYYSEFDGQLKIYSEIEESNKQKKNQEKQFFSHSCYSDIAFNSFNSNGVTGKLKICNSQTDFNYVSHSYW